jgi:hypothetical protein
MDKHRKAALAAQIALAVIGTLLLWNSGALPGGVAYLAAARGLLLLAGVAVYMLMGWAKRR